MSTRKRKTQDGEVVAILEGRSLPVSYYCGGREARVYVPLDFVQVCKPPIKLRKPKRKSR